MPGAGAKRRFQVKDPAYGPLPALLGILTLLTGFIDAVTYLKYGHVFVANMTGNVVFLGFGVAGEKNISMLGMATLIVAVVGVATYASSRGTPAWVT
jgi:uncharacterized membrane protein YoaK (UPF0700 family)